LLAGEGSVFQRGYDFTLGCTFSLCACLVSLCLLPVLAFLNEVVCLVPQSSAIRAVLADSSHIGTWLYCHVVILAQECTAIPVIHGCASVWLNCQMGVLPVLPYTPIMPHVCTSNHACTCRLPTMVRMSSFAAPRGNVVLIGDARATVTPSLGQVGNF
jgi:hypothetical protein